MRKVVSYVLLVSIMFCFASSGYKAFAQTSTPEVEKAVDVNEEGVKEQKGIFGEEFVAAMALLGAGIAMGFGAIGPGIGEGFAAGKACEGIAKRPDQSSLLTRTMLIGQAVSESTGIYSLVIALLLYGKG